MEGPGPRALIRAQSAHVIVLFVMTVAAVGLAIIIGRFRHRESLNPDSFMALKW